MFGLSRKSSRRDRLRGLPLGIVARACALPCTTAQGFSWVCLSIRAGGWGRVFSFQGACGLRPPCVACFVPSCACRLRPGLRPAGGLAVLASTPWGFRLAVRCVPVSVANIARDTPKCQALFAKKISGWPVTPLRGVKNFFTGLAMSATRAIYGFMRAGHSGRNDPGLMRAGFRSAARGSRPALPRVRGSKYCGPYVGARICLARWAGWQFAQGPGTGGRGSIYINLDIFIPRA